MAEEYLTVLSYYIYFIYFSVDGHLGCFHALVTVNNAARNSRVQVSFCIIFMPRSRIAGSYGNGIFSFIEEPPYCFPLWLYQFTFLLAEWEISLFSTSSLAFVACGLYNDSHSD